MDSVSGIGVLDKAVAILDELQAGPASLREIVARSGVPRATAHRLASALEVHGLVGRDGDGRYVLGTRWARPALVDAARPVLEGLRDRTGESVQLYVRQGGERVCLASLESPHSLRTIVPVGSRLPLDRGSAGRVLQDGTDWAATVEEREKGVASVSAAVRDRTGRVVAAVSVSGPVERTSRRPGARYGDAVRAAARELADGIG